MLVVVMGCSLFLITFNVKKIGVPFSLEPYVIAFLTPVQSLVTKTVRQVSSVWDRYLDLLQVEEENELLKKKLQQLTVESHRHHEIEKRYQRLAKLLDFKARLAYETVAAEVVARDSTSWYEVVIINRGTRDGIKNGMAVVAPEGLVGQVFQVSPHGSKVLLITDFRSSVDALIQRSRHSGILIGSSREICEMKYLPMNADVHPGDWVISSGMGGIFPKGLPIGRIVRVNKKGRGFFQEAEVALSVDMNKLEEVLVITGKNEESASS
ncbi:MAG: rod shape-determining protein MreC [Nitrospinae bacterium]|nr:rod shape-determining protein MreC [Nitrospinota bacterium]